MSLARNPLVDPFPRGGGAFLEIQRLERGSRTATSRRRNKRDEIRSRPGRRDGSSTSSAIGPVGPPNLRFCAATLPARATLRGQFAPQRSERAGHIIARVMERAGHLLPRLTSSAGVGHGEGELDRAGRQAGIRGRLRDAREQIDAEGIHGIGRGAGGGGRAGERQRRESTKEGRIFIHGSRTRGSPRYPCPGASCPWGDRHITPVDCHLVSGSQTPSHPEKKRAPR